MKKSFGEEKETLTLYRGIALEPYAKFAGLGTIDKALNVLFSEIYPPLCSNVANRFNTVEAYKRYRALRNAGDTAGIKAAMNEHFKGERNYSFFVSASENEAHAVFFSASTWKDNDFGAVVRFRRNHDYEIYSPTDNIHPYREALVVSCIEPREIDKIYVVGCKHMNHLWVEDIYKREEDGRIQRYRSPDPAEFTYLKNVVWTAESFFNPPIETLRKNRTENN